MLSQVAQFEVVGDQMTGPLIYGFSEDAVAAAKVVADFAKTNDKLVIRGGAFGGKALDVERREAAGQHSFQGSVAGAALGLMHVADLAHRPWCWPRWQPRSEVAAKRRPKLRPQKQPQLERAAIQPNLFRKSKWHSIKTHF